MFKDKIQSLFNRKKKVEPDPSLSLNENKMTLLQSSSLGFSVVEQQTHQNSLLIKQEWETILKSLTFDGFAHQRIYFNFLKGIPNQYRLNIWLMMSCPESLIQNTQEQYLEYLNKELSEVENHQITVDIKRTFGNIMNYQWTSPIIKRILSAASTYKHSYTQGMNYILIYILIFSMESQGIQQINQINNQFESKIFAVFVGILDKMERIFGHNLQKFMDVMKQLQMLLMNTLPQLLFNIVSLGFDVTSLLSQNYFSLMMYAAPPFQLAKMILDLFQLQGHKAIHAILVRMLQLCSEQLLAQKNPQLFQKIIKTQIFNICATTFIKQKQTASSIQDFGLCIFQKTQFQ